MVERGVFAALAWLLVSACSSHTGAPARRQPLHACSEGAPDYQRQIAPILRSHCADCHSGDGSAAEDHDLSSVGGVYAARDAIARQVGAHAMPPRPRPPLGAVETETLLRWAACAPPPTSS
jgi:mono/diheme cytochrome c family protein